MDSDVGRRKNVLTLTIFSLIVFILFMNSRINKSCAYILANEYISKSLTKRLFVNGYYIKKEYKHIYKIYPIMY